MAMAAKTGKLTANKARKEKFLRRDFGGLGGSYRSGRCDVSNCGTENNGLWKRLEGEGMGLRQWAERHQIWQVNPHFHYRGDQRDRGPIGSTRWCCWRGRRRSRDHPHFHYRGDQRDRGPIGSTRWCCWRGRRRSRDQTFQRDSGRR